MEADMAIGTVLRHVRLELAREREHPDGDANIGYDLVLPLSQDGRIDAAGWARHREACRAHHFGPGGERAGRLRRKPGGSWFIDYEPGDADDEGAFRFDDERFVPGEYVSIRGADAMHTYRVVSVR